MKHKMDKYIHRDLNLPEGAFDHAPFHIDKDNKFAMVQCNDIGYESPMRPYEVPGKKIPEIKEGELRCDVSPFGKDQDYEMEIYFRKRDVKFRPVEYTLRDIHPSEGDWSTTSRKLLSMLTMSFIGKPVFVNKDKKRIAIKFREKPDYQQDHEDMLFAIERFAPDFKTGIESIDEKFDYEKDRYDF